MTGLGLCTMLDGATLGAGRWVCGGSGWLSPLTTAIAVAGIIAAALFAARSDGPAWRRGLGLGAVSLALLLLAIAVGRPALETVTPPKGGQIVAVIDRSDSVTRDGTFPAARDALLRAATARLSQISPDDRPAWRAATIAFDGTAGVVSATGPVASLISGITLAGAHKVQAGNSNLAAGLRLAVTVARTSGLPTEIMLASDGNWIDGDLTQVMPDLLRLGIAVHVLPMGSTAPAQGLIAADLAPVQTAGAPATVRTVLRGAGTLAAQSPDTAVPQTIRTPGQDRYGQPVHVRTRFDSRGIRYADVGFAPDDGDTRQRVLMTAVRGPARVTAFGTAPWLDVLPPDRFEIQRRQPADGLPNSFSDVVVIDAQAADAFDPGFAADLARTVAAGTGVFLTNGRHAGSLETPTLMSGWEETALGPLLPVNSDGREVLRDHPPREVVVIIDASGSMGGGRLDTAKRLATRVIKALRPIDKVEVLRFASDMSVRAPMAPADATGQSRAIDAVNAISSGGDTDPEKALAYAGKFAGNYCGMFFISDGDFTTIPAPPGCFTTVFEINETGALRNPHLARLGDVQPVRTSAALSGIEFRYLEPEPRTETFRPGPFTPVATTGDNALVPPLPVDGLAISYPRVDADRIAVHSDLPADPLVAFRRDVENPLAHSGVFMSQVPPGWAGDPRGAAALTAYMDRLVGWSKPDSHAFGFDMRGDELWMSITPTRGSAAVPGRISALVVLADGRQIPLIPDRTQHAGRFAGTLALPDQGSARDGLLLIRHGGEVVQRVPISLPPRRDATAPGATAEAASWGINTERLRWIADATGGQDLTDGQVTAPRSAGVPPVRTDLHPPIIVASLFFFALGLWGGGGRP